MSTSLGRSSIRSTGGHYLASLTIGKLYPLDSGIFTCEAIDPKHRTRVNGSYELRVLSKPQVKVYPLSSTVYSLQTFTVSCFSVDYDPLIGYNWLKNGEILNPLYDSELIEDLYPAGIRLIVPKALTRAVYTCLVTTPLGTVGKESILTVIPSNLTNELRQTCSKETHEDVDWPETAIDGVAVEPCPPGYKDGGVTRRRCFANGKWDEADFSSCLNYQMFYIQEKLMSLTLGYHLVSHSSLMNQLKESLNGLRLKPSQGHFIIHLLESLMAILKLTMDSMETHESSQLALDIISSLLNKPESINSLTGLSNLHRLLMEYSLLSSKIVKGQHNHQITRSNFVVEILNLDHRSNHLLPSTLNSPTIASSSSSSSSASALSSSKHLNNNNKPLSSSSSLSSTATSTLSSSTSIPSWLTDSVQVDITSLPGYNQNKSSSSSSSYSSSYSPKGSTTSHSTDQLKSVLTVFYQNLTSFLPKNVIIHKDFTYEEYQIHSKVVTVALVHRAHYIPTKPYPLRVTAHLRHYPSIEDHVNGKKITCGLVQFNERIGFETQNCQTSTETSDSSSTICICDITGAYSVLVTSQFNKNSDQYNPEVELNPTDQEEYPEQYQYQLHQNQHQTNHVPIDIDNLLIISFLISIGLITLTIIIILIRSRFRLNCLRCLKLQICLATIGIEFSFMATYQPMDIISIPWMNIFQLILFFQLVCNCLQISLCTIVYASVSQYNYGKHDVPYVKITFLGWVIPLSLTGAAVVASDLDDSYRPDKMTDIEGQYFYFTNGSALFITIIHLILVTILKIKFSDRHKKELLDSFRRLDNGTKILNQSLLTIFWTDFFLIANFYYRSSRKIVSKYFISVLSCLLGLNVIICYGFFAQIDENFLLDSGNNLPTAQQQSTKQERESKTTANLPINKQLANNVYALDEMDIASTFNRVTLTEFDVHYEPGLSDL